MHLHYTILFAIFIVFTSSVIANPKSEVPSHWIPPHLPDDNTDIINVSRNMELGIGSGTLRILSSSLKDLLSSGYTKANLKPDSDLHNRTKNGSSAYSIKVGDASWIIIFHPSQTITIKGLVYKEITFWTDFKFYSN